MRTLREISHDTFYSMGNYHQITIDLVQDLEDFFDNKPKVQADQAVLLTKLNGFSYRVKLILEVFNPEFENEISDLKHILSLIEIRVGYVESLEFKLKQ